jgi:hypothetical protein
VIKDRYSRQNVRGERRGPQSMGAHYESHMEEEEADDFETLSLGDRLAQFKSASHLRENSFEKCLSLSQSQSKGVLESTVVRSTRSEKTNIESIVDNSHVGIVSYGDDKITVNSHQYGIIYNFVLHSAPCSLKLSINTNIDFVPHTILTNEITQEIGSSLLKSVADKKFEEFLKGKIYIADECVVCLENAPDCVIFTCGHKCLHQSCRTSTLSSCPVCRANVQAFLTHKTLGQSSDQLFSLF